MKRPGIGATRTPTVKDYCTKKFTLYTKHVNMMHGTIIWMRGKLKQAILTLRPVPLKLPLKT